MADLPDLIPGGDTAFFFDIDGTLAEIAPRPGDAFVPPAGLAALARLQERTGGAVAAVSGRRLEDADRLLAPLRLPVAALHGAIRRRPDGALSRLAVDPAAVAAMQARVAAAIAPVGGLFVEQKETGLALHYRAAPERIEEARRIVTAAVAEAGPGFTIQPGKMVFEIRPAGADKGAAIAAFMAEAPFRTRLPVFAGDDATDEHGFAFVNSVGGVSIKVGAGASAARYGTEGVHAFLQWLDDLAIKR
jgi:trehalose 6-phosphate phosphatase